VRFSNNYHLNSPVVGRFLAIGLKTSRFSMAKNVRVVSSGSGWAVKTEGTQRPLSNHRPQQAASEAGRKVAQQNQSELFIHRPNGQIRDKDSFGYHHCLPKDGTK
jgi:hypothetical protein